MNKTGKQVDVARLKHAHPEEYIREDGTPVLMPIILDNAEFWVMRKEIRAYTPTCGECPHILGGEDVATDGGQRHIYRYDERGDQVCENCGDIRNQKTPSISRHPQESGRYTGFNTDE